MELQQLIVIQIKIDNQIAMSNIDFNAQRIYQGPRFLSSNMIELQ